MDRQKDCALTSFSGNGVLHPLAVRQFILLDN